MIRHNSFSGNSRVSHGSKLRIVGLFAHRRTVVVKRAAKINRLVMDLVFSFGIRN